MRQSFVPDYSVRAVTDVTYIAIKRSLYLTAKRATLLGKSQKPGTENVAEIDDEVEKVRNYIENRKKLYWQQEAGSRVDR